MSKETGKNIVPKLRFPEFRDKDYWGIDSLGVAIKSESSSLAQNKLQLLDNGYPVYGADGLIGYTESFEQDEDYIAIIKDGSGVGRLFLYKKESSILGTLSYLKSQDSKTYELKFLFYLLQTINLTSYIKGSGIPHIYYSDYSKALTAIPKPPEQQKIADCLSSLDDFITAENKKLEALKAHKKGLMQQLFPVEGEIVPKLRFAEFKDAEEWVEKILSEVANYENGKAHEQDIVEEGEYIVVNSKFISSDGKVRKYTNTPFCLAEKDDILMVLSDVPNGKAIAKCFFVDTNNLFSVNQRICKITAFDVNGLLLFYILNRNSYFLAFDDGVKQTNLRNDDVLNFPMLLPKDPKEQQRIAECLSSLDTLITAQTEKIEVLKIHKKGLMQQLFPIITDQK